MPRVFLLCFLVFNLFLVACGGSSSPSDNGEASDVELNKFDISSYVPRTSVDTSSLTGTWLFVGSYDIEYRNALADDDNEHNEMELQFRSTVSIIDNEDTFSVYATEGRVFIDSITAFRDGATLTMMLPRGIFVGDITNNNMIVGAMESDQPNMGSGTYVTVNSSNLGMVKINSIPMLPGQVEGFSALGSIQVTMDYEASVEGSLGEDESQTMPVHYVWEEEGVWREFENGQQLAEDIGYELWLYTILDNSTSPDIYHEAEVENLIIRNTIKEDHSLDDYPLGWAISEDVLNQAGEYGYMSGLTTPIVDTSTTEIISASYSEIEEGVSQLNIDISLQF